MNNLFVKTHKSLMRPPIKVKMNTMFLDLCTIQSRHARAGWNAKRMCAHLFSNEFYKFLKNFCWKVRVWLAERVESGSPDLPMEQRRQNRKARSSTTVCLIGAVSSLFGNKKTKCSTYLPTTGKHDKELGITK